MTGPTARDELREAVTDFLKRWDNPERYHRLPAVENLRAALAAARSEAPGELDAELLARALCASRPPDEPADLADALFVDDECRGIARRAVEMYAKLREARS